MSNSARFILLFFHCASAFAVASLGDRERGLQEIRETALHGYYLKPFANLLAVAALRDNNPVRARELLGERHRRFPDNELYTREVDRIDKGAH